MNDPRAKRARPTSPVEALLFDLDGTLVDSEPFHRQTLRNWFAARGWPADEDLLAGFAGRRPDDVLGTQSGPWDGEDVAAMMAEIGAQTAALPSPELTAGAVRIIRERTGPIALVTSGAPGWARTCLGDLLDHFDVVITRDDVQRGKPDPEPYVRACAALGLEPSACAAVEDAPAGIRSAIDAGIGLVIGLAGTFAEPDLAAAHVVVDGLDDIPVLLESRLAAGSR